MLSNMELYGVDIVPKVSKRVCSERITLLEKNLVKVKHAKPLGEVCDKQLIEIIKAIQFWQRMRDEK